MPRLILVLSGTQCIVHTSTYIADVMFWQRLHFDSLSDDMLRCFSLIASIDQILVLKMSFTSGELGHQFLLISPPSCFPIWALLSSNLQLLVHLLRFLLAQDIGSLNRHILLEVEVGPPLCICLLVHYFPSA